MKKWSCIIFIILSLLAACRNEGVYKNTPAGRYYYLSGNKRGRPVDTQYVDSPDRKVATLQNIYTAEYDNYKPVYKFTDSLAPVDGQQVYYYTEDFGIIYSKGITWKNFRRLHSTNDSIERAIGAYIDLLLTNQNLVVAGEEYIQLGDSVIHLEESVTCEPPLK